MTLFTDSIFLTNEVDGFRVCRETRSATGTTIILCKAGYIDVYYRGEMLRIGKDDMFIRVPDATELGPYEISDDYAFIQVTIPSTLFEELMFDHMRVEPRWWQKLEYLKEHPIYHLTPKSIEFCEMYFNLLVLQMQGVQTDYRRQIMMLIARGATMEILNFLDKELGPLTADQRSTINQSDYTFHKFTHLLRNNPHQREVQWYAKQLDITPKYLSEISRARSGKSASEWIMETTVSEIKHHLLHTTLSVRDIARLMEFPNASFFCQYTKKHLGMSPSRYRKTKKA